MYIWKLHNRKNGTLGACQRTICFVVWVTQTRMNQTGIHILVTTTPFLETLHLFQPPCEQKINSFKLFVAFLMLIELFSCNSKFCIFSKQKIRDFRHFVTLFLILFHIERILEVWFYMIRRKQAFRLSTALLKRFFLV